MLQNRTTLAFDKTDAGRMKRILRRVCSTHGASKTVKLTEGKLECIYYRHIAQSVPVQEGKLHDCTMTNSLKSLPDCTGHGQVAAKQATCFQVTFILYAHVPTAQLMHRDWHRHTSTASERLCRYSWLNLNKALASPNQTDIGLSLRLHKSTL